MRSNGAQQREENILIFNSFPASAETRWDQWIVKVNVCSIDVKAQNKKTAQLKQKTPFVVGSSKGFYIYTLLAYTILASAHSAVLRTPEITFRTKRRKRL